MGDTYPIVHVILAAHWRFRIVYLNQGFSINEQISLRISVIKQEKIQFVPLS